MSSSQHERPENYYEAYIIDSSGQRSPEFKREGEPRDKGNERAGRPIVRAIIQILLGALLLIIGIPMLILPGPGLLSIIAGIIIVANGAKSIFRPTARTGA